MKTRKHGNGLSHLEVVRFSNRLVTNSRNHLVYDGDSFGDGFERGWNAACKYFAHELRLKLREIESCKY